METRPRFSRQFWSITRLTAKLRAEKSAESVHHWSMTNDFKLIVFFACPDCATVYTASQKEQPVRHPGCFHCRACATPVHEWSGLYGFTDWQLKILRRKRIRQRA